ncbi:MAG TPA: hypothetical protein PKE63_08650, partial [Lacibacter sp.]|nr:hypothetical protein [Lacibacter sp.]
GSGAFIAKDATGFYPENLLWTYPFLVKSFINTSYLENTLIAWGGTWSLMIYYALLLFVTVFICTKLFQYLVRRLWQLRPAAAKAADAEEHWQQRLVPALANFLLMGVSLAVLLLLTVLSLRYDAQKTPEGAFGFTYVHESRYFLGSSLLLLLLVSRLLQEHPFRLPQLRLLPVRRLAIATLLVVNLSLFGKFLVNVSFGAVPSTGTAQLAERKKVEQTLLRLKEKNNLPIVVAASVKYFAYQPQPDVAVLQDYQEVLQSGVRTSQPVQLVLITRKQLSDAELKFIYQKGAVQVYAGNRCRLYHVIAGSNEQMAAR